MVMIHYRAFILVLLLFSCDNSEPKIQTYRLAKVPQENLKSQTNSELAFKNTKIPETWESIAPGPFQLRLFKVKGTPIEELEVSISYLPYTAGKELDNINRWRSQIKLPPITESEAKQSKQVNRNNIGAYSYFDFESDIPNGEAISIAYQVYDQGHLFVKLKGLKSHVHKERETFTKFLQMLKE